MSNLDVGDKVILNDSMVYKHNQQIPKDLVGTVVGINFTGTSRLESVRVDWSKRCTGTHFPCELVKLVLHSPHYVKINVQLKRPKLKQKKAFIRYKDGSSYLVKGVTEVVVDTTNKQIHISNIKDSNGTKVRQNTSIDFKDVLTLQLTLLKVKEVVYIFENEMVKSVYREFGEEPLTGKFVH